MTSRGTGAPLPAAGRAPLSGADTDASLGQPASRCPGSVGTRGTGAGKGSSQLQCRRNSQEAMQTFSRRPGRPCLASQAPHSHLLAATWWKSSFVKFRHSSFFHVGKGKFWSVMLTSACQLALGYCCTGLFSSISVLGSLHVPPAQEQHVSPVPAP